MQKELWFYIVMALVTSLKLEWLLQSYILLTIGAVAQWTIHIDWLANYMSVFHAPWSVGYNLLFAVAYISRMKVTRLAQSYETLWLICSDVYEF